MHQRLGGAQSSRKITSGVREKSSNTIALLHEFDKEVTIILKRNEISALSLSKAASVATCAAMLLSQAQISKDVGATAGRVKVKDSFQFRNTIHRVSYHHPRRWHGEKGWTVCTWVWSTN
jgi:hypothetical protein